MKFYVGQSASFSKTISESDVYLFAGISGDFNPVHVNKIEAEKSIFGKQIVHGMLSASFLSTVLGMYLPGNGTIYLHQEIHFQKPVYIGDTLTAYVEIVEIKENGIAKLKTLVTNQNDIEVIDGIAKVKLPNFQCTNKFL